VIRVRQLLAGASAGAGAAARQAATAEFESLARMLGGQLRNIPRLFSERTELTGLYEKHRVFVSALRKPRYPGGSATSARIELCLRQPSPRTFSVEQGDEASAPLPPELRERLSRVAGGTQGHWRLRVQREEVLLDLRVLGVPGADLLHVWLDWLVALANVLRPIG
jgi:hypothetical protein